MKMIKKLVALALSATMVFGRLPVGWVAPMEVKADEQRSVNNVASAAVNAAGEAVSNLNAGKEEDKEVGGGDDANSVATNEIGKGDDKKPEYQQMEEGGIFVWKYRAGL